MNTGRAMLGTMFVAIGGLVLLDRAGAVDASAVIADWWPTLFLVGAVLELLARPRRPVSAAILAALGGVLLVVTTGAVDASVWAIAWPVAIVALGLWLLLRPVPQPIAGRASSRDERFDVTAVFAGRQLTSGARPLRRGTATAIFGGVELDLTGATIEGEAVLDLVALFGGVEVHVPGGWHVLVDGPAIFGGHENHVPPPADPHAPVLRVRATTIFGGVDIEPRTRDRDPVHA